MGKKSKPAPVAKAEADLGNIGAISEEQTKKQYDWANERQEYDQQRWRDTRGVEEAALEDQLKYSGEAIAAGRESLGSAAADRERYEELYQPIEEQYLEDVQGWDTEGRRTSESARAQTEVASQMEAGRTNALRRLESYGVDPSQTRNSALDSGIRMEEAKQKAMAGNAARSDVEKTGMALKEGTIGKGRGLNDQANRNFQTATGTAGSGAGGIPTYGADQTNMWGQGNTTLGNWGDAASGAGSIAQAGQNNRTDAFGNLLGAGATLGAAMLMADGGEVEGPGGPKDDAIDAKLSDGEFVIPEEVVRRKGTEFFDKLIEKVKTENAEREQNAQITAEAMATPPPEVVAPEGMSSQQPAMANGGEIQSRPLMFNKGGEVVGYADGGAIPVGYAHGGPVTAMEYPAPPTARMGAR